MNTHTLKIGSVRFVDRQEARELLQWNRMRLKRWIDSGKLHPLHYLQKQWFAVDEIENLRRQERESVTPL